MKSVTGIIPEEFMQHDKVLDVMKYLSQAPLTAEEKTRILVVWAHNVGVKISSSQRAAVAATGTDVA